MDTDERGPLTMRIRTIKPGFWRSDDIDALSIEDRLLFIGLWQFADDEGRGCYKPSAIMADLFAGDMERNFTETSERVHGGLKRLESAGLIVPYDADGRHYFYIPTFADHQVISRPTGSKLPPPPDPPGTSGKTSDGDRFTDDSRSTHGSFTEGSIPEGEGEGEKELTLIPPADAADRHEESRPQRRRGAAGSDPPGFTEWWKLYPRKVGKGQARKAYAGAIRRQNVSPALLIATVTTFAKTVANTDPKFIPYPATWLNGERWADEPAPRPRPSLMDLG